MYSHFLKCANLFANVSFLINANCFLMGNSVMERRQQEQSIFPTFQNCFIRKRKSTTRSHLKPNVRFFEIIKFLYKQLKYKITASVK